MATIKPKDILIARQKAAVIINKEQKEPNTWSRVIQAKRQKKIDEKDWKAYVQNPLGIYGGKVANVINNALASEEASFITSGIFSYTRLWRARLLMKSSPMQKSEYNPRPTGSDFLTNALPLGGIILKTKETENLHYTNTDSSYDKSETGHKDSYQKIQARRGRVVSVNYQPQGIDHTISRSQSLAQLSKSTNNIYIINASRENDGIYSYIQLQNRPDEVKVDPKGNWATVYSMGRNNPFLMYTGGEDSISLDISWFVNDPLRRDEVIQKCRLLESWSKADGYNAAPPLIKIRWGNSDLFSDQYFILESAQYTLSNFQDRCRANILPKRADNENGFENIQDPYGGVQDLGLYPNVARQSLMLKKVSDVNITHNMIVPIEKLTELKGITIGANQII